MSFGENVTYYRKKLNVTQEELAERLSVSRQTVSRWETDSTFPDVEMLIRLCELFECDMDTLVRKRAVDTDKYAPCAPSVLNTYNRHMNRFALAISLGVWFIVFSVALMLFISGFEGRELLSVIILLICVALSVSDFIFAGVLHCGFMKENPRMCEYPKEEQRSFLKKFAAMIVSATVLVFIAVIALIIMCYKDGYAPTGFTVNLWQHFSISIFLVLVSVSVFLYVYAGILYSKYNVKEYNKSCIKEGYAEGEPEGGDKKSRLEKINDTVCSVIMLSATAVFLLLGFIGNLWHPAWVAFPIGGILCGISSVVTGSQSEK